MTVQGNRQYNPGWHLALDLHSMLTVAEAVTRSAIERKESRGGHTRDDYPGHRRAVRQGQRGHPARRRRADGRRQEPLPEMPDELKRILEEKV